MPLADLLLKLRPDTFGVDLADLVEVVELRRQRGPTLPEHGQRR
ncbi:hypothetical protein [Microbispora hainanensis]|uniref:Uncharacterized protein n=1 Tax=Microbispora hainanensis TaxID=568844 RepID=A0ABZ1SUG8_9ACTN|nr:hypothetical protein [Microbispora hainanensis]